MKLHMNLFVVGLLLWNAPANAQGWTQHKYSASPDEVYRAAVKVIELHHGIKSKDPDNRIIRFHIGMTSWSYGYNIGLSVEPERAGTSIAKTSIEKSGGPAFSRGSGKKEIQKIFKWIDEELATKPVN